MTEADSSEVHAWLATFQNAETARAYKRDIRHFLRFLGGKPLRELLPSDIVRYRDSLRAAPRSVARMVASVKSLLRHGRSVGYLAWNPAAEIGVPAVPKREALSRDLHESETRRLIWAQPDRSDRVLCWLFYQGGLRTREAAGLCWRHILPRVDGGGVQIFTGTESALRFDREVPISPALLSELQRLRGVESDNELVFGVSESTLRRRVNRAALRAGIGAQIGPRDFREAHAIHALRNGAPPSVVAETLGVHALSQTRLERGISDRRPSRTYLRGL